MPDIKKMLTRLKSRPWSAVLCKKPAIYQAPEVGNTLATW